jgi:sigma-B regulation protein RsbQ
MEENILLRNNVKIKGTGSQPMLFVNGYGCDSNIWRFIYPEFEKNYKVILFDHVGTGDSQLSEYSYEKYNDLQGYADDIIELCRKLSFEKTIIVGHSVGCIISMLAVIKAPEFFDKVILLSPSPCYINQEDYEGGFSKQDIEQMIEAVESNYLGWVSSITPVITGNADRPELAEELSNRFCRNNPDIAKHFARVTFLSDNRKDLPELSKKTLILQVTDDVIAPVSVGEYMHKTIPDNRLEMIEANGHCPHLSHPADTIRIMKSFLQINQ